MSTATRGHVTSAGNRWRTAHKATDFPILQGGLFPATAAVPVLADVLAADSAGSEEPCSDDAEDAMPRIDPTVATQECADLLITCLQRLEANAAEEDWHQPKVQSALARVAVALHSTMQHHDIPVPVRTSK